MTELRCSNASREAGESLGATATMAESWLLVEVRAGWSRDVGSSRSLPEPAREAVDAWVDGTPASRLLFVRRPGRSEGPSLAFVVNAPESGGTTRRLELESLEDLADVDLSRDGDASDGQLVLVCGHGSRDPCCALRGTAVFGVLAARLGDEELWISSHQGGHRFAANVLVLPAGLQLGRIEPEEAPFVVARALAGRIELDRYRGRSCYEPIVQAAELAVRRATGLGAVPALRLVDVAGTTVRFRGFDGVEHVAEVAEAPGPPVRVSCGAEPEPQRTYSARVL